MIAVQNCCFMMRGTENCWALIRKVTDSDTSMLMPTLKTVLRVSLSSAVSWYTHTERNIELVGWQLVSVWTNHNKIQNSHRCIEPPDRSKFRWHTARTWWRRQRRSLVKHLEASGRPNTVIRTPQPCYSRPECCCCYYYYHCPKQASPKMKQLYYSWLKPQQLQGEASCSEATTKISFVRERACV